jgi:hypothetical protein
MRRIVIVLALLAALFVPASAFAEEDAALPEAWIGCPYQDVDTNGEAICLDEVPVEDPFDGSLARAAAAAEAEDELPASCRLKNEVLFWTDTNWLRVARNLALNPAPCTEYYIGVPPMSNDKTQPRRNQAEQIREFGPQFHALHDIFLADLTGWVNWVRDNRWRFSSDEETWYQAGVRARELMALPDRDFDVASGDSWLLNDFNTGTRRDGGTYFGLDLEPWNRKNMRALVRGLHEGPADGSLGRTRGLAQVAIQFTHQNIPFIDEYKADWKDWLEDDAFWADIAQRVRWLGKEVYADSRYWGTPDTSRNERSRHLQEYFFHVPELAEAGPESVATARSYLRESFVPLVNGTWAALGPDRFVPLFCCGHGETMLPIDRFLTYVTEELFAVRQYAGSHPQGAPAGRLGFTWQPTNNFGVPNAEFLAAQDAIVQRIAEAVRWGYREGGASPAGICSPPGSEKDWCDGGREGAHFTDAWKTFESWE